MTEWSPSSRPERRRPKIARATAGSTSTTSTSGAPMTSPTMLCAASFTQRTWPLSSSTYAGTFTSAIALGNESAYSGGTGSEGIGSTEARSAGRAGSHPDEMSRPPRKGRPAASTVGPAGVVPLRPADGRHPGRGSARRHDTDSSFSDPERAVDEQARAGERERDDDDHRPVGRDSGAHTRQKPRRRPARDQAQDRDHRQRSEERDVVEQHDAELDAERLPGGDEGGQYGEVRECGRELDGHDSRPQTRRRRRRIGRAPAERAGRGMPVRPHESRGDEETRATHEGEHVLRVVPEMGRVIQQEAARAEDNRNPDDRRDREDARGERAEHRLALGSEREHDRRRDCGWVDA